MPDQIDPIQFEVIRNALLEATEEMAITLRRSAYSTNIKTRADFSCAFFDRDLRPIAQAFTQPVHLGSLTILTPRAVAEYGRASSSGQRTGVVGSGPANLVPHPTKTHATCLTGTAATSAHGRKHRASMRPLAQTTRTGLMVTAMGSRVRDCGASNPCSSSPRTHGRVSLLQRSGGADFKDCN